MLVFWGECEQNSENVTYKAISARLARLPIGDDHCLLDVAESLEESTQRLVGGVVGQSADKDFCKGGVFDGLVVVGG